MRQVLTLWLILAAGEWIYPQSAARPDPANEIQMGNLKGLKAMGVIVADLDPDLRKSGLIPEEIEADTEARLRQSGIRVLTGKQRLQTPGRPYLYVVVTSGCQESTTSCAVELRVALMENIPDERDSTVVTNTAVWRRDSVTVLEKKKLHTIRNQIAEFIEQFKTALQVANR